MKIAIIGYSGSGKSTLAKRLSKMYGCPILYLDTVNFEAGWKERNREESREIVRKFMKNDSWIIDGNYREFYQEERLEEADKIIFMNFSRITCFKQAFMRYLKSRNKVRESMAEGCIEKFDFEFVSWILKDGRTKNHKKHFSNICRKYNHKTMICKNRKDVEELMKSTMLI